MTYPPTAKQAHLLRYIAGYQEAHGYSPTFERMKTDLGYGSKATLFVLVDSLIERGLVAKRPGKRAGQHSTIEVLHEPSIPRAPDGSPLFAVRLA